MARHELKPIKEPVINKPPTQRDPNNTGPTSSPTPVGNFLNPDKDYSKSSEFSPEQVNRLHSRSDLDRSSTAQHHTLGIKHFQAAPGDHDHTGKTSRKMGHGLGLTITGSKGSNAALASLLTFLGNFFEFTDSTT